MPPFPPELARDRAAPLPGSRTLRGRTGTPDNETAGTTRTSRPLLFVALCCALCSSPPKPQRCQLYACGALGCESLGTAGAFGDVCAELNGSAASRPP